MAKPVQSIADVSHPGKTPPSDSSRSIIVTNRPIMQDPDVKPAPVDSDSLTGAPLLDMDAKEHDPADLPPSQKKITITPPNKSKEAASEAVTVTVKSPQAADSIPEVAAEAKPEAAKTPEPAAKKTEAAPKPSKEEAKPVEPAKRDDVPDEDDVPDAPPVKDEKQLAADAAQAAKVAELIKRQVYVLPINAVERRRSHHFVIGGLLLIIILAFVWLDLAADAGFVHVPHLPLTHFFRV